MDGRRRPTSITRWVPTALLLGVGLLVTSCGGAGVVPLTGEVHLEVRVRAVHRTWSGELDRVVLCAVVSNGTAEPQWVVSDGTTWGDVSSSELTVHLEKVPLPDGVTEYAFIRPRVERLEPRSRVYRQIVIRSSVRPEFDPWSMPEGEAEAFDPEDPTTWGPRMGWPEPVRLETPLVVRVVVGVGGRNGPGPFRSRNRGEFHAWQQLLQDEVLIP